MFCRHCGKRFQPGTTWYYQPIWILVLGLFVMGPLVLPLVWKSPAMSRNMKLAVGAGIAIYTALLVYFTWLVVAAVYGQIQVLLQEVEMM